MLAADEGPWFGLTHEVLTRISMGDTRAAEPGPAEPTRPRAAPPRQWAAIQIPSIGLAFAGYPSRINSLAAQDAALTHWAPACRQSATASALLTAVLVRGERDPIAFGTVDPGLMVGEVVDVWYPCPLRPSPAEGSMVATWDPLCWACKWPPRCFRRAPPTHISCPGSYGGG